MRRDLHEWGTHPRTDQSLNGKKTQQDRHVVSADRVADWCRWYGTHARITEASGTPSEPAAEWVLRQGPHRIPTGCALHLPAESAWQSGPSLFPIDRTR